jgi:hypothetical protein
LSSVLERLVELLEKGTISLEDPEIKEEITERFETIFQDIEIPKEFDEKQIVEEFERVLEKIFEDKSIREEYGGILDFIETSVLLINAIKNDNISKITKLYPIYTEKFLEFKEQYFKLLDEIEKMVMDIFFESPEIDSELLILELSLIDTTRSMLNLMEEDFESFKKNAAKARFKRPLLSVGQYRKIKNILTGFLEKYHHSLFNEYFGDAMASFLKFLFYLFITNTDKIEGAFESEMTRIQVKNPRNYKRNLDYLEANVEKFRQYLIHQNPEAFEYKRSSYEDLMGNVLDSFPI